MPERKLHNVVTEWKDGRHFMTTSRIHIFVWMLEQSYQKIFDNRMFDQDYFVQERGQPPQPVASDIANAICGLKKIKRQRKCVLQD